MIQGSGVTNCSVGTPSSNKRATTFEKLCKILTSGRGKEEKKGMNNILLEPKLLAISVSLGEFLEWLILYKDVIGTAKRKKKIKRQYQHHFKIYEETHGNIIKVFVFLSSSCLGPFHFFHTHLSLNKSWKKSFVTVVGENVQGPSKPERSTWQRPSACAPERATISWSLKLDREKKTKLI